VSSDKEKKLERMINSRKKKSKRKRIEDKKSLEHNDQYRGNTEEY
jgi:hypothetical protein